STAMRRLLGLVLVFAVTGFAGAADDKLDYNKLTPQEAAEGWLLLFDGESTYGWTTPSGSKWTIANGMLAPQADKPGQLVTTTAFRDYELKYQYRMLPNAKAELFLGCDREGKPRNSTIPKEDKGEKGVPGDASSHQL